LDRPPDTSNERRRRAYPLRSLLVLLSVGVLVPPVVFAGVLVSRLAAESRALDERRSLDRAITLAGTLDRELSASIRALHAVAQSERLARDDLAGFHEEAMRLVGAQPSWYAIRLLSSRGRVLVDTAAPRFEPMGDALDGESLRQVVETGEAQVGTLARGGPPGRWVFPIRVPVRRDGRTAYVLTAVVTSGSIETLIRAGSHDEWARTVIDSGGTVVARTRDAERWVGGKTSDVIRARAGQPRGVFRDLSLEGVPSYVAYAPATVSGWSVAVLVPSEVIDGPARRFLLVVIGLGLLVVVLSGGTASWAAVRISRSIGATVAGADAVAAGSRPRLHRSRVREVAQLHLALERGGDPA
jgi:hypothetical protein